MTRQDIMNHHRQTMQVICTGFALAGIIFIGFLASHEEMKRQTLATQESHATWK